MFRPLLYTLWADEFDARRLESGGVSVSLKRGCAGWLGMLRRRGGEHSLQDSLRHTPVCQAGWFCPARQRHADQARPHLSGERFVERVGSEQASPRGRGIFLKMYLSRIIVPWRELWYPGGFWKNN